MYAPAVAHHHRNHRKMAQKSTAESNEHEAPRDDVGLAGPSDLVLRLHLKLSNSAQLKNISCRIFEHESKQESRTTRTNRINQTKSREDFAEKVKWGDDPSTKQAAGKDDWGMDNGG
ncbi:hypothetical protein BHE74_00007664 [Ensete ventricosum]|nr:hypothetical protein BHE74_00007664 [Ensete ventricosum]RZS19744.1 hypothetical protein BHM03_00052175 [Ensete ventricosum]